MCLTYIQLETLYNLIIIINNLLFHALGVLRGLHFNEASLILSGNRHIFLQTKV